MTLCGCLLTGLAACTFVSNSATTRAPVLNSDGPVPGGSGLYSLQLATDNRVGQFTLVRFYTATGKPLWRQAIPGNDPDPLIGISDGIFYAVNGLDVLAFSGRDGSSIWHTTLNPSVQARSKNSDVPGGRHHLALVVADGHIYIRIGGGRESLPEQVVAVRASDGAQLWSRTFDHLAAETASSDLAVVTAGGYGLVAGGDGLVIVNSGMNGIQALHAPDGALAWQAQYQEVAGEAQMLGGLVYVDEGPTGLVALDEHTGALAWTLPCWKHSAITPSPSGAQIYVECLEPNNDSPASEGVFAFDTQQHQMLWKYHAFDFNAAPVADANLVFIPYGTVLDAVRASDGKQVWRQQAEELNAGPDELAVLGDTLYVRMHPIFPHVYVGCGTRCERSYSLSALRPSDGAVYWRDYEPGGTQGLLAA